MRLLQLSYGLILPALALGEAQILQWDIGNISSLLTTLNDDAANVVPGIPGLPFAIQVQVDSVNLDKRLLAAVADAKASPKINLVDSLSLGIALIGLTPKITDTLKAISAKTTAFGELGIIVLSSLKQMHRDTSAFSDALVAKLDPLAGAVSPVIVDSIDKAFVDAVAAYQSNAL